MLGFQYFKADPTVHVIQTSSGQIKRQGKGLSFFYYAPKTSLTAIPMSAKDVPFIFNLQTADYQHLRVQGQLSYRAADPQKLADMCGARGDTRRDSNHHTASSLNASQGVRYTP